MSGFKKWGILCYLASRQLDGGSPHTSHWSKPSRRVRSVSWRAPSCQQQVAELLNSPPEASDWGIFRGKAGQTSCSSWFEMCQAMSLLLGQGETCSAAWSEPLCPPADHSLRRQGSMCSVSSLRVISDADMKKMPGSLFSGRSQDCFVSNLLGRACKNPLPQGATWEEVLCSGGFVQAYTLSWVHGWEGSR